jgi:hypothetical protein
VRRLNLLSKTRGLTATEQSEIDEWNALMDREGIITAADRFRYTLRAIIINEENAAKIAAESAAKSAIKSAVKSSTAGVPKATPGAAQIPSNVTVTSPAAASFISSADSATALAAESVQSMEFAIDENLATISSNSDTFTTVARRHHNRPLSQATTGRLSRTVYLTGHQVNIAKVIAIDHAEEFQQALDEGFGPVSNVEVIHDSIRITCTTQEQKDQLLLLESVLGHDVKVTLPHCITKSDKQEIRKHTSTSSIWKKGVIRTPLHFEQSFLKAHTGAVWTHRITVMRDGKITETPSVILAFEGNIPDKLQIGLYSFKVEPYIPKPIRCGKCQRYGHKTRDCKKSSDTCPRCADNHPVTACNSDNHAAKCVNCGGKHSAAYKGCIKYKSIATALKSTVTDGLTYGEALKKNNIHSRPKDVSNQTATSKQTATPTKQDSSTQTESHTATQTDITNDDLAEIVKATVNWLLGQIKVTANQKSLLEALQKQYVVFTTMIDSTNPTTTIQIP